MVNNINLMSINLGLKTFEIKLDGLTPKQKELQLKFLSCRRHTGDCLCYLTGQNPRQVCKHEKKLSRSWIKSREPIDKIITCNDCNIPFNRVCENN